MGLPPFSLMSVSVEFLNHSESMIFWLIFRCYFMHEGLQKSKDIFWVNKRNGHVEGYFICCYSAEE
ncbi:MAG: hypothetical protein D3922_03495 [Candidatus Electrothrix sp. AR1]|nr:hypothetical protein [Candidatus Electrothrix sp. AR1]